MNLTTFRKEYSLAGLRRRDLASNPIEQFQKWFQQAVQAGIPELTAMSVATVNQSGQPSLRTVLLKEVDERGFIFCTSYESQKGRELRGNQRTALSFFWKELERQVTIKGIAARLSTEESEEYFRARPVGSQLGAWASQQSSVVTDRSALEKRFAEFEEKYSGEKIPMPPHWGGYVVSPDEIQFWQGGINRLHDRFRYIKTAEAAEWLIERLAP